MGFSASESRLALRSCHGDITAAVSYVSGKREVLHFNKTGFLLIVHEQKLGFLFQYRALIEAFIL